MSSAGEFGVIGLRGTEVDRRYSYFFFTALQAVLEQERAQLRQGEQITDGSLFKFFVASMGGGTMGAKWPMKPEHLIELARDADRISDLMHFVKMKKNKEGRMVPDPGHPDGLPLIQPYLDDLFLKYSVMMFRAFRETPVRKWLEPQQEKAAGGEKSPFEKLLSAAQGSQQPTEPAAGAAGPE